jgi:hypothetical protein
MIVVGAVQARLAAFYKERVATGIEPVPSSSGLVQGRRSNGNLGSKKNLFIQPMRSKPVLKPALDPLNISGAAKRTC